ncbi:MAG: peptide chain release factor N(5)-glutamine methyltransferase, partial [Gammaproteobacteria bacterium]|nr:peptide chain release factor N(5)-glutamine methyltransferase [Gammaproteobacteria bacterium]
MHAETQSPAATIEALLRAGVRLLEAASPSPRLDAEVLLAHVLGRTRIDLFRSREAPVEAAAAARFLDLVSMRREHRPVAQLVGRREFWSLDLEVTANVLVPRPETELLVERALALAPADPAPGVFDLGTGSGAIALALASERPAWRIVATDCSAAALEVARRNARRLGCAGVSFALGDWYAAVPGGRFDLIVSNPPYIADHEWAGADPELAFEPRGALAAGADGLDHLRRIAAGAPHHLLPGGALLVEHGACQAEAVRALLAQAGLTAIGTSVDLSGQPRVSE